MGKAPRLPNIRVAVDQTPPVVYMYTISPLYEGLIAAKGYPHEQLRDEYDERISFSLFMAHDRSTKAAGMVKLHPSAAW